MMLPLSASSLSNLPTSTSFLSAQSLAKTPLRDVLKARCKERMRAVGDSFLEGKIQIFVEAREEVEVGLYRNKFRSHKQMRPTVFQPLEYINIQGKKVRILKNVSKGSP